MWVDVLTQTSKAGEFYIQADLGGEAETTGECRGQSTGPQELAKIMGETGTSTDHGIGRRLSHLYVDVKEARGHQMVFGSQFSYIK